MAFTDYYAVLGNPIAHSKSPLIHALFAAQTGQQLQYGKHELPLGGFGIALQQLRAGQSLPAGARLLGCNVTVPFKQDALQLADRVSERATLAQACNVLHFTPDGVVADNTDGLGLVQDIAVNAGFALAGKRVLMIGAGGAGAGVLAPLLMQRPAVLTVCNRTVDKAQALVDTHRAVAQTHGVLLQAMGLDGAAQLPLRSVDVIINASSSSLTGATLPLPAQLLVDAKTSATPVLAYDMMYGPAAQAFMDWVLSGQTDATALLSRHQLLLCDGLGMLVQQAALSFHLWRGVMPDTAPVLAQLRQLQPVGVAAGLSSKQEG